MLGFAEQCILCLSVEAMSGAKSTGVTLLVCSGLLTPDTHLGENARHREVSDDQATPYLYP
ncbi:hypothetical protein FDK04_13770 [Pseudomonas aeruginosa]|nr:hypothetical protein [Pseudomonas aeruginosa]QGQ03573.1 hypothetical protein FDK04_13770 [Pseudomonas aeruginosa]